MERTVTIGEALDDQETGLTRVGDVVVLEGRLFVAQPRERCLRIFSLAGEFLGVVGREGEGPGEFGYVNGLGVRDGLLWASDSFLGRVQYFDPGGQYVSSLRIRGHPTLPIIGLEVLAVLADGSMLARDPPGASQQAAFPDRPEHVIRLDERGSLRDTASVLVGSPSVVALGETSRGGISYTMLPESYRSQFSPSPDGTGFVVLHREAARRAEPHTFRVIRFDAGADTVWARDIQYDPIPVTSAWRSQHLKERDDLNAPMLRELRRAYRRLEFFPPVRQAKAGADGTTWLRIRTGVDAWEWEVLDRSGRSIARVGMSPQGWLKWAGTDTLWFLDHDEFDVPYLVKYTIRRP
ncbi:MAG: 6-bladed beta-propeller [Gemmatimonadetes bacterium]|nr:6-bladed beta-propeller [Gemmatimonadota bacterium]MCY3944219.1 6-bladed beta-propeller [Gemmatimonadota bacterium]